MRRTSPAPEPGVSSLLRGKLKTPEFWICSGGLAGMTALFILWLIQNPGCALPARLSALTSALLFTVLCLRFVPEWMSFWRFSPRLPAFRPVSREARGESPPHINLKIFLAIMGANAAVLLLVFLIRRAMGSQETFVQQLEFWRCLDSGSYLRIAKDWYPAEGDTRVMLVFLPGYPVAIRLIDWLIGNELYSGLLVSALSVSGAGCMMYRLLRLDYTHEDALRTIKYAFLLPGFFFYTAPMSEGLFLLLCLSCLYFARTGRWTLGCLFGGLAAFTRSMGITLLVPLVMELIRAVRIRQISSRRLIARRWIRRAASLLLVAAGLAAYLLINYLISGDPFKFQEYQSSHWGQRLGFFFNTAAYQLDQAVKTYAENNHSFLGLWLPNMIACFGSLILLIFAAKRMRASYIAWFIAYFFVAIGATWLLSAPRYLMVMLPVPLAVSMLVRRPTADLAAAPFCVLLSLLYLYAFVARWQVW